MNIQSFLQFNNYCPICGEKLTLFLQQISLATSQCGICFKGEIINESNIHFTPFKLTKSLRDVANQNNTIDFKDGLWRLNSNYLNAQAKKQSFYLFYLCDPRGFSGDSYGNQDIDYEINLYKGCYHRSSPQLHFSKSRKNKFAKKAVVVSGKRQITNYKEDFSFKSKKETLEKVYMLSLNYDENETKLWYYAVSDKQKEDSSFSAYNLKIFEKTLPLLNVRPDFSLSNRDKLLERFDSWILMS